MRPLRVGSEPINIPADVQLYRETSRGKPTHDHRLRQQHRSDSTQDKSKEREQLRQKALSDECKEDQIIQMWKVS